MKNEAILKKRKRNRKTKYHPISNYWIDDFIRYFEIREEIEEGKDPLATIDDMVDQYIRKVIREDELRKCFSYYMTHGDARSGSPLLPDEFNAFFYSDIYGRIEQLIEEQKRYLLQSHKITEAYQFDWYDPKKRIIIFAIHDNKKEYIKEILTPRGHFSDEYDDIIEWSSDKKEALSINGGGLAKKIIMCIDGAKIEIVNSRDIKKREKRESGLGSVKCTRCGNNSLCSLDKRDRYTNRYHVCYSCLRKIRESNENRSFNDSFDAFEGILEKSDIGKHYREAKIGEALDEATYILMSNFYNEYVEKLKEYDIDIYRLQEESLRTAIHSDILLIRAYKTFLAVELAIVRNMILIDEEINNKGYINDIANEICNKLSLSNEDRGEIADIEVAILDGSYENNEEVLMRLMKRVIPVIEIGGDWKAYSLASIAFKRVIKNMELFYRVIARDYLEKICRGI